MRKATIQTKSFFQGIICLRFLLPTFLATYFFLLHHLCRHLSLLLSIPPLWLLTLKQACLSNLMKMAPIFILGSLYSSFIVELTLWILTFSPMTPLKH